MLAPIAARSAADRTRAVAQSALPAAPRLEDDPAAPSSARIALAGALRRTADRLAPAPARAIAA